MNTSEEVLGYLLDGVSVDLVGRTGSGRSEVAHRVAVALEREGRPVVRLRGVRAQRDRALGVAIIGNKNLSLGNYTSVREFSAAFTHEVRPGAVIVVDDADDLDPATTGVIGSLHATTKVPLLVTRRMPYEPSGSVRDLVSCLHPGVRIALAPLPFDEVHRLVHDLLEGHVEPLTVARIATKSGGLPGLVQAMTIVGQRKGRIAQVDGVWTAIAALWTPELSHTIGAMLAHTCEDDLERLAELAEHGVVDLDTAAYIVQPDRLAHLLRAGFVEILETAAGSQVSVFPPLLNEYLTREYTTSRRLERPQRATGVRTWGALEAHRRALPSEDSILSRVLAEHSVHRTAELSEAWQSDPTPATAVPLLTSMLVMGTPTEEIENVYRRTNTCVGTSAERAELMGWHAVYRAVGDGNADTAASQILAAAREQIPGEEGYFDAVEAHLRFVLDRVPYLPQQAAGAQPVLGQEATTGVFIESALARGMARAACDLMDGFSPRYRTFHSHKATCWGLALVLEGRLREGVDWALDRLHEALRDRDSGALIAQSYVAGLGLGLMGRLREMNEVLSSALTVTTITVLQAYMHAGVLSLSALGALWQGRTQYAMALAHEAKVLWRCPGPYPVMHADAVLALAPAHDAPTSLWTAAVDRMDRGYLAAGVFLAVDAAEQTRTGMSEHRILDRARDADSPLLEAMLQYADAICTRDADAMESAAWRFEKLGADLYVVRARISRALLLRDAGDLVGAVADVDSAWTTAQRFDAPVAGLFAPFVAALDISAREMEVIELLSTGLTTSDIAAALTVSARTVENHVFSVYRKVGVDSRGELRRIACTWLRPEPERGA